jgi:autoinducer 2-degrading protein
MHVTIVAISVKADCVERFIEASRANHQGSVAEPGNRRFDVLQNAADPTQFVLYEAYATADDAARHKETAHYAAWRDTVADMMAAPRQGTLYKGLLPSEGGS